MLFRSFNRIQIEGEIKRGILLRPKYFEIIVYFTPVKKTIFDIYTRSVDINDKRLKLDFKIGDNISKAKDWVTKNGHEITFEKNK